MYKIKLNGYIKYHNYVEEWSKEFNRDSEEKARVVFQNLKNRQYKVIQSKYEVNPTISNKEIGSISGKFSRTQRLEYKSDDGETHEYYEITYSN